MDSLRSLNGAGTYRCEPFDNLFSRQIDFFRVGRFLVRATAYCKLFIANIPTSFINALDEVHPYFPSCHHLLFDRCNNRIWSLLRCSSPTNQYVKYCKFESSVSILDFWRVFYFRI